MLQAIVKNHEAFEGYVSANIPHQLGYCTAMFAIDNVYPVIMDNEIYVNYCGSLINHVSITIYDGTLDGHDSANGVKFDNLDEANKYFTFYD